MKNVLILSFPYASAMGGGERYTETLVRGLKERGWNFTLVSSSAALHRVFRENGWPRHEVRLGPEPVAKWSAALFPLTALFSSLALLGILLWFRFARRTRVVVCLSLTEKLLATGLARALGMKAVWVEHLLPGRSLLKNPFRPVYALQSREAEIVTVSRAARDAFAALGVPRARLHVISPGAAMPAPAPGPSKKPVIGCVARLHKEKNVQMLLDAFTEVLHEVPEARLELYGDGPEREALEAVVRERRQAGAVSFRGWVDAREGYYGRFRVLAVPSEKESFGLAALEGMAHGLPVVAARVGGLGELVAHTVTGFLVDPGDASGMARALVRLLGDEELARRLGAQGRAFVEREFTEAKMFDAWGSLLKS